MTDGIYHYYLDDVLHQAGVTDLTLNTDSGPTRAPPDNTSEQKHSSTEANTTERSSLSSSKAKNSESPFPTSEVPSSSTDGGGYDSGLSKKSTIIAAVCGSIGGVLVIMLVFFIIMYWRRCRHYARDPVQDYTVQGIIADDIGGAEAPKENKPIINQNTAPNTPDINNNNNLTVANVTMPETNSNTSNVQRNSGIEEYSMLMPPAYEEQDSRVLASTSDDHKVDKK